MNTITTQLPFKGVMTSYIGGRKENQDTCGYSDTSRGLLLVVCDGMGGGPGGKTASSIAATSIIAYVQQAGGQPENEKINNETLLHDAVVAANRALRDKIAESPELSGMGTTVTAVLITASGASLAHVGDSRIYQLRRGKIVFRTADHSRVGEMVRAGALTDEQARLSAISNLITRALGIGDEVEVDTTSLAFEKGDRFVLCTDGVWGSMPQPDLVKSLTENKSLENTAELLNVKVENAGIEKGGHHDNYTMIIAETTSSSAVAAKNDAKAKATVGINDEAAEVVAKPKRKGLDSRILALIITAAIITPALIFAIMYIPMGDDIKETDGPELKEQTDPEEPVDTTVVNDIEQPSGEDNAAPVENKTTQESQSSHQPGQPTVATTRSNSGSSTQPAANNESSAEGETISDDMASLGGPDKAELEAKKQALTQAIEYLTRMRAYVESMKNSAGKTAQTAITAFLNAKKAALEELEKLRNIRGYSYSDDENYMLFANQTDSQLKATKKFNGIAGSLGGETATNIPDKAGCTIIIEKRIDVLLNSMNAKLQEVNTQLQAK